MEPNNNNTKEAEIKVDRSDELVEQGCDVPSTVLGLLCFPFVACCSSFTLQEREEAVILRWGKYQETIRDPGIHYSNCCGRDLIRVMKTKKTFDLPNVKVADLNGNPLIVSGIVTWFIEQTKKFVLNVDNAPGFLVNQATAVMKSLVSRYPYESSKGACLKSEGDKIGMEFVAELQKKVDIAGIKVIAFQFNEISYAPEIAALMLKKQQAGAMLEARQIMVKGAVDIAYGVCTELASKGIDMDNTQKVQLVSNLLTVISSEQSATPTIPLQL